MGRNKVSLSKLVKAEIESEIFPIIRSWGFVQHPSPRTWFGWDPSAHSYFWSFKHPDCFENIKLIDIHQATRKRIDVHVNFAKIPLDADIYAEGHLREFTLHDMSATTVWEYRMSLSPWRLGFLPISFAARKTDDLVEAKKRARRLVEKLKPYLPPIGAFMRGEIIDHRSFQNYREVAARVRKRVIEREKRA